MRLMNLLLLLVMLTACSAPLTNAPALPVPGATPMHGRPPQGKLTSPLIPRLWLVTDPSAVLSAARANSVSPEPPTEPFRGLAVTSSSEWLRQLLEWIAQDGVTPNRAARELMLVSVALNDAMIIGQEAGTAELVDQPALLAGAAWSVLRYLHPQHSDLIDQYVQEARWQSLWLRDPVSPEQLEYSFQIGRVVGDEIVAWARQDGSDAFVEVSLPMTGGWQTDKLALDPHWGEVKTVVLPAGDTIILPPPPAWDSDQMEEERKVFYSAQQRITDEHRELAWRWHADIGTVTPAGIWFKTAITTALLSNLDQMQITSLFAHLGVAMHDTTVACWNNKYRYGFIRPEQWMATLDPSWQPELPTPPHPSYPSGHASLSSAAASILIAAFPQHREVFAQFADDATRSRIVGGVHWVMDGAQGMALGRDVVIYVLTR
ncbi:MAG: PA-phosphatase [Pirellulaceae bacterium]|nr:MAG: PA-phosphatase [Pirellulaceae bacterium]